MTWARVIVLAAALVGVFGRVEAQTVTGSAFRLTSGPCTVRSGTGVPSTGLGSACDVYVRLDSPYGVYHKLDSTTWVRSSPGTGATGDLFYASSATEFGRLSAVVSGQVLASAGTGAAPAWTGTPTISGTVTLNGNPGFLVSATNAQVRLSESDGATDNKTWVVRAENEAFTLRANNDANTVGSTFLSVERTGTTVDNMTLSPSGGDLILAPGGLDILPDTGYTKNLGALTNKYLTLHAAELWVETLVAQNTIATIGGRILVGPTTSLTADVSTGATSISVKHNQMVSGDRVVLQANGSLEWMAITSGPSGGGPYTYSVTRNLDGSGANAWYAGDAVFNTGTTGNGFIDLYSVDGVVPGSTAGPTIVGNVRTGTTYSQVEPRWAIGNLNGLYGYGATTYGAAFGDNANAWVKIDPTNGVRIGEDATTYFQVDPAGNATFAGRLTVGTGRNWLANTEFMRGRGTGDSYANYWGGSSSTSTTDPSATYTCTVSGCTQRAVHGSGWSWTGVSKSAAGDVTIGADESGGSRPLGSNTVYAWFNGSTPANGTAVVLYGPVLPIDEAKRYEFSAYVGMNGTWTSEVRISWYGVDGGDAGDQPDFISESAATTACTSGSPGANLGTWCRSWGLFTPPANARLAQLALVSVFDGGDASPIVFWTRPYFGEAGSSATQNQPTPWGPGGHTLISGDMLSADLVVANTLRSSSATALTTGTGYWLDASTSTPTFRVGNPAGAQVKWDGTNLTITSQNVTLDSAGIQIAPSDSNNFVDTRDYGWTVSNGNLGLGGNDGSTNGRYLFGSSNWSGSCTGSRCQSTVNLDARADTDGTSGTRGTSGLTLSAVANSTALAQISVITPSGAYGLFSQFAYPDFRPDGTTTAGALCGYIVAAYQGDTTNTIRIPFYAANGGSCPTVP